MVLILVALGVAVMSAAAAVIVFRIDINTKAFNAQAKRLIATGNIDRLKKLCAVVPLSPYVSALGHAVEQGASIAGGAASKADLQGRLRDCFHAAFDERAQKKLSMARSLGWMGLLSSIAVAAPAVLLIRRASVAMIAGLLGLGIGIFAVTRVVRITRSRAEFDEIAGALAQHFDGERRVEDGAFRSSPAEAPRPDSADSGPTGAFVGGLGPREIELTARMRDGREVTALFEGGVVKIGRAASAHFVVADASVSRLHALIEWESESDAPTIIDLGSAGGTSVDGERVSSKQLLHSGAVVEVGEIEIDVRFGGAAGVGGGDDDVAGPADDGAGEQARALRCSSCGADELREVTGADLERLRGTAPSGDAEGLRARVCRSCGRIDWYVDPTLLHQLS